MDEAGPLVKFARFNNGQIELFNAHTRHLQYIAVSHVWGDYSWRYVPVLGREAKISEQKDKFVSEELLALVGDIPFWMDTLTVNQRDDAEILSTVQAIPSIFRDAQKTLAVRECDGVYACCTQAAAGARSLQELHQTIALHVVEAHDGCLIEEADLQRLWTLQECLLSHTIEFVSVSKGSVVSIIMRATMLILIPGQNIKPDTSARAADPFHPRLNIVKIFENVKKLAFSFSSDGLDAPQFIIAYLFGGTVTRGPPRLPSAEDNICSNGFWRDHLCSTRVATMPRDYIFATMTQFPWYHYPPTAAEMTFAVIFADLRAQALAHGHHLSYRILCGMLTPHTSDDMEVAWSPATDVPEPRALGDFLKLFRGEHPFGDGAGSFRPEHPSWRIKVRTLSEELFNNAGRILDLVETSMKASRNVWAARSIWLMARGKPRRLSAADDQGIQRGYRAERTV
tara:strand:- start:4436 stop:5797 length:1362 start_codon:yes stop_codon:yes gene_type:complete